MGETPSNSALNGLQQFLVFFFSGLVLAAISIISGGYWLGRCFNIPPTEQALFRIPVPGVFKIEARGNEVLLGLTAFVITLLATGWLGGSDLYLQIKSRFGLELSQFNALCTLSAFLTLAWTFLLFLLWRRPWGPPDTKLVDEQQARLDKVTESGPE